MAYKHLTKEQRYQIYILLQTVTSQKEIAKLVNCHPSTISRELRRNKGLKGYRPKQAHNKATNRQANNAKQITSIEWQYVIAKLNLQWSPEQISHFINISHESIYRFIYADKRHGGKLYLNLRHKKKYRQRTGSYDKRGSIINPIRIDERPNIVEQRTRLGDIEVDTIIGHKHRQAIVSVVDRVSGYTWLKKVNHKTANNVSKSIVALLKPIKGTIKTITADNGKEFAYHQDIAKQLDCDFYFAHPYSSWQRGTNENTNGLVRQYFPKKMAFAQINDQQIQLVMHRLNHRPRKRLNYQTPAQVFWSKSIALRC